MTNKNFIPRSQTTGSMSEQLRALLPGKNTKRPQNGNARNEHQKPMSAPKGKDGVNHINIYEDGSTDLGRCLAHSTPLKFQHRLFGNFSNIEAFWHYIRSDERDDRIRNMIGKALKDFSKMLHSRRVVNFVAIILDANWQKVNQYPELKEAIKQSDLPFECYSCYKRQDGVKIRPTFSYWLIPGFEEIRKALKENRQPDFTDFLDNPELGLFGDVIEKNDADIVPASSLHDGSIGNPVVAKPENKELAALLRRTQSPEEAPVAEPNVEAPQPEPVVEDQSVIEIMAETPDGVIVEAAPQLLEPIADEVPFAPDVVPVIEEMEPSTLLDPMQVDAAVEIEPVIEPVVEPETLDSATNSIGGPVNNGI